MLVCRMWTRLFRTPRPCPVVAHYVDEIVLCEGPIAQLVFIVYCDRGRNYLVVRPQCSRQLNDEIFVVVIDITSFKVYINSINTGLQYYGNKVVNEWLAVFILQKLVILGLLASPAN